MQLDLRWLFHTIMLGVFNMFSMFSIHLVKYNIHLKIHHPYVCIRNYFQKVMQFVVKINIIDFGATLSGHLPWMEISRTFRKCKYRFESLSGAKLPSVCYWKNVSSFTLGGKTWITLPISVQGEKITFLEEKNLIILSPLSLDTYYSEFREC